jgi:hypothetical protein
MKHPFVLLASALLFACAISSCSTGVSQLRSYQAYDRPASLPSHPGAVRVKISLRHQMVYVFEGSKPLLIAPCTVGTSSASTPQGNFKIFLKRNQSPVSLFSGLRSSLFLFVFFEAFISNQNRFELQF